MYSLPQAPFVAGTVISSAAVNSNFSDIATALTGSLATNGSAVMTGQVKGADGSTLLPSLTFATDTSTGFSHQASQISVSVAGTSVGAWTSSGYTGAVASGVPVGTVVSFMGSSAPSQWYLCFGQAVSRTTFSALFAVIGTTYGVGDGSTTFNLPDLRGRQLFGLDNMGGSAASRLTSTYFGSATTTLGDVSTTTDHVGLVAGNIPSLTSSGSNSISVNASGFFPQLNTATWGANSFSGGGTVALSDSNAFASLTSAKASTGTNTITVTSTGTSGTAFSNISPAMVVNTIIFAAA